MDIQCSELQHSIPILVLNAVTLRLLKGLLHKSYCDLNNTKSNTHEICLSVANHMCYIPGKEMWLVRLKFAKSVVQRNIGGKGKCSHCCVTFYFTKHSDTVKINKYKYGY